jgi:serine/threonine protein kinase
MDFQSPTIRARPQQATVTPVPIYCSKKTNTYKLHEDQDLIQAQVLRNFGVPNRCDQDWFKGRLLAKGVTGKVYELQCGYQGPTNFVAKIIAVTGNQTVEGVKRRLDHEVNVQKLMYSIRIAPAIVESFFCEDDQKGYIIMEYSGLSLKDWFDQICASEVSDEDFYNLGFAVCQDVIQLLARGRRAGVAHDDINIGNYLVHVNPSNILDYDDMKMVDFTLSKFETSTENDYQNDITEVQISVFGAINSRIQTRNKNKAGCVPPAIIDSDDEPRENIFSAPRKQRPTASSSSSPPSSGFGKRLAFDFDD